MHMQIIKEFNILENVPIVIILELNEGEQNTIQQLQNTRTEFKL